MSKMTTDEFQDCLDKLIAHEASIKKSRDRRNELATAIEEGEKRGEEKGEKKGIEEGCEEERANIARKMKDKGFDFETISEITGLTIEEIENL